MYAKQILEHFDLAQYFTDIHGSELNGDRTNKAELIQYILAQQKLQADQCMMVGDREHDIFGARQNGIDTIAVNYGYGSQEELALAQPKYQIDRFNQLLDYFK